MRKSQDTDILMRGTAPPGTARPLPLLNEGGKESAPLSSFLLPPSLRRGRGRAANASGGKIKTLRTLVLAAASAALAACSNDAPDTLAGYVEAELLYIAAQDPGVIAVLAVGEGARVEKGAPLFSIDPARMALSVEQAQTAASAAGARVGSGGPLEEAVAEAQAQDDNARRNYARTRALLKQGVVTQARVDNDRAAFEGAGARLARTRAERDAAARDAASAQALADLWKKKLADLAVTAPEAGVIERVYRRPGEIVAAGDPVLALLPPDNIKVRFYAPEARLSGLAVGGEVGISCDRCAEEISARITYVATEPQFTPPVIYSVDERDKLVFLVEARPGPGFRLTPGLPVTVRLP